MQAFEFKMTPEIVASIGLALDIIGVILIWKYGLGDGVVNGCKYHVYSHSLYPPYSCV